MADALLGIVIDNLGTVLREELATFWGVESQIEKLSSNLTAIHAVLQDAEERQITSHAVKLWLQKLTDDAYVLDDILDQCSIEFNRPQFEEQNSGSAQKALNMCLTPFHPKTILFRRDIGQRMKEIIQKFHDIDVERRTFGFRAADIVERQPEDDGWRQTTSVVPEHKVYGRDEDKEKIVEFLVRHASDSEELCIYPIVGIGGLGKTTLAKLVFNDDQVSKHFDLKIWVCVADNFSVLRILQSILESATGKNPHLLALESFQKEVQKLLQSKRYLLVLDDVWNEEHAKWQELKSVLQCASGIKGASILVTTRLNSVASIMGTCPAHHLSGLSEEDSWSLFKFHAFGPNGEERAELVPIGKEIVKKCVGSPLASKALGSLLRFKNEKKQWLSVKESKFWEIGEDNAIMRALRISYFNLKLSLRRCFSFCAVFPEDFEIDREQLIHLWMANGFIKSRGHLEVEDVGNEVWSELYQKSFFQEVKTDEIGNIKSFKMHDLFHDLAKSIVGEECVSFESASLTNLSSRVHHIICLDSNQLARKVAFKKVQSLRTFVEFSKQFDGNFHGLPSTCSLRALSTGAFLLSGLKNLIHLRYLELNNSMIMTLPQCITMLQKLQTLKLEGCDLLSSLPKHLTRLQDLRHLIIKGCGALVATPPKIRKLTCLKTLSIFIVGSKTGFGLAELHDLQLGGKLHIKRLENVHSEWDAKEANLIGKKDLNQLYLSWGSDANSQATNAEPESVIDALKPNSNLKSFGIKGYGGIQFPSWMRDTCILENLVDITLYDCKNCQRLPPLGKLPHLASLEVSGMTNVKYMDDESYDDFAGKAFKSLKKLILRSLPNLERMLGDEAVEMLPLLSELIIHEVPKLKLPCLPSVEHLKAYGTKDGASFSEGIVRNLPHLKTLRIDGFYKLKVILDEIGSLGALEGLEFWYSDAELESYPEHMLQGLTSLRTLKIIGCEKLKSLSEGVGHLTCLEYLQISDCPGLVTLPSSMNQLTALRQVEIIGNRSGKLPEGLQRIPSLQSLSVLFVDSLPEWLGDMTSLQQLCISDSPELRSLPSSFRHLTNLRKLSIINCGQLEKRCKNTTGEEWPKIAHIPQIEMKEEEEQKETSQETFCEIIRIIWNGLKLKMPDNHNGAFDMIVDGR